MRIEQFVLNYNTLVIASLLTLDLSSLKKHVLLRIRWWLERVRDWKYIFLDKNICQGTIKQLRSGKDEMICLKIIEKSWKIVSVGVSLKTFLRMGCNTDVGMRFLIQNFSNSNFTQHHCSFSLIILKHVDSLCNWQEFCLLK